MTCDIMCPVRRSRLACAFIPIAAWLACAQAHAWAAPATARDAITPHQAVAALPRQEPARGASLRGTVIDARTATPLAGVRVEVASLCDVMSDAAGQFACEHLPAGTHDVVDPILPKHPATAPRIMHFQARVACLS